MRSGVSEARDGFASLSNALNDPIIPLHCTDCAPSFFSPVHLQPSSHQSRLPPRICEIRISPRRHSLLPSAALSHGTAHHTTPHTAVDVRLCS